MPYTTILCCVNTAKRGDLRSLLEEILVHTYCTAKVEEEGAEKNVNTAKAGKILSDTCGHNKDHKVEVVALGLLQDLRGATCTRASMRL